MQFSLQQLQKKYCKIFLLILSGEETSLCHLIWRIHSNKLQQCVQMAEVRSVGRTRPPGLIWLCKSQKSIRKSMTVEKVGCPAHSAIVRHMSLNVSLDRPKSLLVLQDPKNNVASLKAVVSNQMRIYLGQNWYFFFANLWKKEVFYIQCTP